MDKEYLVKKWLNNDLSDTEAKAFNALEDADLYKEIIEESQRFSGNINAKVESFDVLDNKLVSKKIASTNWIKVVSSIAAALVVGFALLITSMKLAAFSVSFLSSKLNLPMPA